MQPPDPGQPQSSEGVPSQGQLPVYPFPPPYYYPPPPRSDSGKIVLIIVVVVVILVMIPIVISAVLYFMVSGLIQSPGPGPTAMGINLSRTGTNWTATIVATPSGKLPSSTLLTVQNAQGVTVLPLTAFSSLNWPTDRGVYEDANPGDAEIRAGDRFVMDVGTYPAGDTFQVIEGQNVLVSMRLQ